MKILEITSSKYNYNNNANSRLKDSYDLTEAPANPTPNYGSKNTSYGNINYKTKAPGAKKAVPLGAAAPIKSPTTAKVDVEKSVKKSKVADFLSWLGITAFVVDYWVTIQDIEQDYVQYIQELDSGKSPEQINTKYFKNLNKEEALAHALKMRERKLGEVVSLILLQSGLASKMITGLALLPLPIKVKSLVLVLANAVKFIEKNPKLNIALMAYLASPAIQGIVGKIINLLIPLAISEPIGTVLDSAAHVARASSVGLFDSLVNILNSLANTVLEYKPIKTAAERLGMSEKLPSSYSKIKQSEPKSEIGSQGEESYSSGKKVYLNGVQFTDDQGNLLPGMENLLAREKRIASMAGLPEPLPNIKVDISNY